ncbi:MAG: repeat-containing protein [Rhodospirillales bacterium]|nr:repeat-containing protein [Geminicoccaceae bacterium]MDF2766338.1 repeat-containing protein [Rhodospirillales bacterium]
MQVTYLGFPGSTGSDFIDYLITDRILSPDEHRGHYSEQLVRLPHAFAIDYAAHTELGSVSRADVDLPEDAFVFCSFNAGHKIEPATFARWMRILGRVPGAVLWLCPGNPAAAENLRREAEKRGVGGSRLLFARRLPYADNLARLPLADLVLDTCIYNGGVTTSDALWAGVPVVTQEGSHYASRMGSSILRSTGLPELVAPTLDQYEAIAIELAGDPDRLAALRRRLLAKRGERRPVQPGSSGRRA